MTRLIVAGLALLFCNIGHASEPPRIAIIIDDLGYERAAGERAIGLPGALTVAILPNTPSARALADAAHASGKEVIVHLPLQAVEDEEAGDDTHIDIDTTAAEFASAFDAALASVPHAVGVNNHRGSLLTRHPGHMQWLMDNIRRQPNWYFVDSYTTHLSVALRIAEESGVPALKRDVFLDSSREPDDIQREIERLKLKAKRNGRAVAIGHPYPETLAALEAALPQLAREGFELVSVSSLIRMN